MCKIFKCDSKYKTEMTVEIVNLVITFKYCFKNLTNYEYTFVILLVYIFTKLMKLKGFRS